MGVDGAELLAGLDVLGGEPIASYAVGGTMLAGPGVIVGGGIGKGFDWLTGKYDKTKCP
jgi:hypothetical protein